ncbi:MAG: hypothetical protein KME60_22870 [Cyanomargarita calcarea GSE-NOS-MK-12-04C]|uniref:Uncharacterized protein n=1 Tax=Cyanomargarita calcarea GSE-NOS-MK-12-04C TaxID=2839659 RepID=A0A951QQP6_9CYAN|nr:hypothetical protein [Cyanomargarita calcarea GSE-NOS-MK-12-04C]
MSNSSAVNWVIFLWCDGAIASRIKMEIDAPTTKLKPSTIYGRSGTKVEIKSMAIARVNITSSTNLGGLYWLDKIKLFNQKCQYLILSPEL